MTDSGVVYLMLYFELWIINAISTACVDDVSLFSPSHLSRYVRCGQLARIQLQLKCMQQMRPPSVKMIRQTQIDSFDFRYHLRQHSKYVPPIQLPRIAFATLCSKRRRLDCSTLAASLLSGSSGFGSCVQKKLQGFTQNG